VESLAKLDTFLISAGMDSQCMFSKITSLAISRKVSQRVLMAFLNQYKMLVGAILDPVNKYEFPSSLVSRTVDEVETLLSLHNEYE
jgi:conserved oligomeric Golgi complex subunit 6